MAEFFSDCIKKIKSRLVVTSDLISKVETHIKNEDRGMYQKVIENSFNVNHCLELKAEDAAITFQVFKYYYNCTSVKNVGEARILGDSGGDAAVEALVENCPNVTRL